MNHLSPMCEYGVHDMCRGNAKNGKCLCWCHNEKRVTP